MNAAYGRALLTGLAFLLVALGGVALALRVRWTSDSSTRLLL